MKAKKFHLKVPTKGIESTKLLVWTEYDDHNFYIGIEDFYGNVKRVTVEPSLVLQKISEIAFGASTA